MEANSEWQLYEFYHYISLLNPVILSADIAEPPLEKSMNAGFEQPMWPSLQLFFVMTAKNKSGITFEKSQNASWLLQTKKEDEKPNPF